MILQIPLPLLSRVACLSSAYPSARAFPCLRYRLDLMACCLQWRHLCPTAPDTLTCYPFGADDPFVLQQCPHIMFAGNQPEFDTRLLEGEQLLFKQLITVSA
eukprot:GHRQ01014011.1.p2 GENE.GHRQ01014011.1~~GHRQ01014011.1.p2  ORF type:complete len:102 (-),score=34.37 GHRQ01014011.1:871-1176(-)